MSDSRKRSVDERISDVERRLEFRRGRLEFNVQEIKERLSRKSIWVPLGAVAGALAIGYAVARTRAGNHAARRLYLPRSERRAGIAASVLGIVGGIARLAMSSQGRALWQAFRRGVERGRAYGHR